MTKTKIILAASVFAAAGLAATGAGAVTPFNYEAPTAEMPTDTAITDSFLAPVGGVSTASFTVDGYGSLDGQNAYEDDFTLSLNGAPVLTGTFNLGGGGNNVVYSNPNGGVVDNISGNGTDVTFDGGHVVVDEPLDLVTGLNRLTFSYTSRSGGGYAGFQGLGDEGWGLERLSVGGATAVPEPDAWALMLVGFGGVGVVLRTRRRQGSPRAV